MSDHIKTFWDSQGEKHGVDHWASWGDHFAIQLEIDTIGAHLAPGAHVLDVGCANGYSALRQAERGLGSVVGVDFSEPMIEGAKRAIADRNPPCPIEFSVADIRKLPFEDARFDAAYTTRVLINLATWDEQVTGIEEVLRVVKPGGTAIFSEGFWEPLCLLNSLRALKQLPPLVEHDFNRYLKQSRLEALLDAKGLTWRVEDFSSVYYLGSRFLRELVTNPADYPGYSNPVNERFYELEKVFSGGGFGVQQAYVVTKS